MAVRCEHGMRWCVPHWVRLQWLHTHEQLSCGGNDLIRSSAKYTAEKFYVLDEERKEADESGLRVVAVRS